MFEFVAKEMTTIDVGGEAGRQLDITEARQALSVVLKVFANKLTLREIVLLISDYGKVSC